MTIQDEDRSILQSHKMKLTEDNRLIFIVMTVLSMLVGFAAYYSDNPLVILSLMAFTLVSVIIYTQGTK